MYKPTVIWVSNDNNTLAESLFGIVATKCISECLKMDFKIKMNKDFLGKARINDSFLYTKPHVDIIRFPALDGSNVSSQQNYFELEDIEKLWNGKHIMLNTTQNIFQHFAFTRQIEYKILFLRCISCLFSNLFDLSKYYFYMIQVNNIPGIHIKYDKNKTLEENESIIVHNLYISKQDIIKRNGSQQNIVFIASNCEYAYVSAKKIFSDFTVIENPLKKSGVIQSHMSQDDINFMDLYLLSKCKSLYLDWNSSFSRVGALLNPERQFLTYNHPEHFSEVVDYKINELIGRNIE